MFIGSVPPNYNNSSGSGNTALAVAGVAALAVVLAPADLVFLGVLGIIVVAGLVSGCDQGGNDACNLDPTPRYSPIKEGVKPMPAAITPSEYAEGKDVQWRAQVQPGLTSCDGTTKDVWLVCKGLEGAEGKIFTPNENGELIVTAHLTKPMTSKAQCEIHFRNPNSPEEELVLVVPQRPEDPPSKPIKDLVKEDKPVLIDLWAPTDATETGPVDQCENYPKPVIQPGYIIKPYNAEGKELDAKKELFVNQLITFKFPAKGIKDCHGKTGAEANLKVSFMADNEEKKAALEDSFYITTMQFSQPGYRKIALIVVDSTGAEADPYSTDININDVGNQQTCYQKPIASGSANPLPNLTVTQGDGTEFYWSKVVTDCNGQALPENSVDHGTSGAVLYQAKIGYNQDTRTVDVSGSLLPACTGGSFTLKYTDNYGLTTIDTFFTGTVNPLKIIDFQNNYFKQGEPLKFCLDGGLINNALNNSFWLTYPDKSQGQPVSNINEEYADKQACFTTTPPVAGTYTIHYAVRPFTDKDEDRLETSRDFNVQENQANACKNDNNPSHPGVSASIAGPLPLMRGADNILTYTLPAVQDDCNKAVKEPDFSALDKVFLPGYSAKYDAASKTVTIVGILRSADRANPLPNPVVIPYYDQNDKLSGDISVYLPTPADPIIFVPLGGAHVGDNINLKVEKVSGATARIDILDLNDQVVATINDFSGTTAIAQSGTYKVRATIIPGNGDLAYTIFSDNILQVYKVNVNKPAYKLNIPFAGPINKQIPMSIDNLADPQNWDISWNFGNGQSGSGINVNPSFAGAGKYNVVVTMTSRLSPEAEPIVDSQSITIVPQGDPVPNLEIAPGLGQAPLAVIANGVKSYTADPASISLVSFKFNWGDGSPEESGAQASRPHTYICANATCAYTARLTITDSNGKTSTISAVVSTWR